MKVNIIKTRDKIKEYNSDVQKYVDNLDNLYNVFSQISFYWQGKKSEKFLSKILEDKKKIEQVISELNSFCSFLYFIIEKYEKIGDTIEVNLKSKRTINDCFDNLINKIDLTLAKYNNLSFINGDKGKQILNVKKLLAIKKNVEILKLKTINTLENIENIEYDVDKEISRMDFNLIKADDIDEYI